MTIIAILAGLMLPALAKGLRKARGLGAHLGGPDGVQMRIEEVVTQYTQYRLAHPNHAPLSRKAFVHQLNLSAAAETWLTLKSVEYRPFASTNLLGQAAIVVYPSEGSGSGDKTIVLTIGDLFVH